MADGMERCYKLMGLPVLWRAPKVTRADHEVPLVGDPTILISGFGIVAD